MISRNVAVDESGVLGIHSGNLLLRSIKVLQKTEDAPQLYLQVFNATSPTIGTTAPNMVLPVPAGITGSLAHFRFDFNGPKGGFQMGTGLSIAVATTHDGNTGPDSGDEPDVTLEYQPIG